MRRGFLATRPGLQSIAMPPAANVTQSRPPGFTPQPEGTRCRLSVLFSDLSGSTALSGEMEAEDYAELLGALRHVYTAAVAAHGGTLVRPAADHFYGERSGTFRDPFGHEWMVGHSVEEVSPAEMQRRWDSMAEG